MDTKALRQKILDLAIRGKLVPQDPSDEPASVLLERIRAEKQQMVKAGKLKPKDIKNDTVIYKGADNLHYEKFADGTIKCIEDEIPFDIPDGWSWTRLIAICPYGETTKINANNITDNEWILGLEDIEKDTGKILSYVLKSERQSVSQKHKFCKGQLLYSKLRPYLNKVLIAPKDGYCTSEILPLTLYGNISPEYIRTFLMSDTFLAYVDLISYGVKMPRLGTEDGKRSLIALPPLQEQFRIDTKLQETLEKIEYLKLHSNELEKIIKTIKSKILDLAIRGKLVAQDPNDEPASVLLERIRAEKEELIKQGKIKRNKKESVIFKGDDNSYYLRTGELEESLENWRFNDLPETWEICCLGELCNYGDCINVNTEDITENAWILDLEDIEKDTGTVLKKVTKAQRNSVSTKHKFHSGQVLYSKLRPYLNKVVLSDDDGYCTSEILPLEFKNCVLPEYARYYLMSGTFIAYANHCSYGVKMPRLGTTDGKKAIFSLPPLSEQKRIVKTIDSYFMQLNRISEALT